MTQQNGGGQQAGRRRRDGILRSLQARLFVVIVLATLPLAMVELYRVWSVHADTLDATHDRAQAMAEVMRERHESLVREAERVLELLASNPAVTAGTPESCHATLSRMAGDGEMFVNVALADVTGTILCGARFQNAATTVPANARPTLTRAVETGRPEHGSAAISAVHDRAVLAFAQPVFGDDGIVRAVLMGGVNLSWFEHLLNRQSLPDDAVVLLTDAQGVVLGAVPPTPAALGKTLLPGLPADLSAGRSISAMVPGGVERLFAFASADSLRVAVGIDRSAVDLAARRRLGTSLAIFAAVLALGILAAQGIGRSLLTTHVRPLRNATERVAQGDFTGRIGPPYHGPAELAAVAEAFDFMVQRIAEREIDLINSETQLLVKRQSEERYRALVEMSPEAIVVLVDGRVVFCNARAAAVLAARDGKAMTGLDFGALAADDDAEGLRRHLRTATAEPGEPLLYEAAMRRLDGRPFQAELAVAPVTFGGRAASHIVLRDVSARTHMERQLVKASKLAILGEVAAAVAHELSQPLNIIRMAADGMRPQPGRLPPPPDVVERAELIGEQTIRMANAIDHMRVFSRRDGGTPRVFDGLAAVRRALGLMGPTLEADGITLDVWFEGEDARVRGREGHLEQIVLNLLTNAREALPGENEDQDDDSGEAAGRPRHVAVTARRLEADGVLQVTVGDTGGRLPEDRLAQVFEPFRLAGTQRERSTGTPAAGSDAAGLGLSIASTLAEAMNGTLSARNEGGGLLFTLRLPLTMAALDVVEPSPDAVGAPATRPEARPEAPLTGHVLVVDDTPAVVRLMAQHLMRLGLRVSSAADGIGALEVVAADRPDVVIADPATTGLQGHTLIGTLASLECPPAVVALPTGQGDGPAPAGPVVAVVEEPISLDDLEAAVRLALARRRTAPAPKHSAEI